MTPEERIAAYTAILEKIDAAVNRVDGQMSALTREFENLTALYERVSSELTYTAASLLNDRVKS